MADEHPIKFSRTTGCARWVIAGLAVLCLGLTVAVIVLAIKLHEKQDPPPPATATEQQGQTTSQTTTPQPGSSTCDICPERQQNIDLDPPAVLPPFHDLTAADIGAVKEFLYRQVDLNLVRPPNVQLDSSYIYTMELAIPNKDDTLEFLDNGQAQPPREAKVVIFRGDLSVNRVEEYVVGPLSNPTYKKDKKTIPFQYRPVTFPELIAMIGFVSVQCHTHVGNVLWKSYSGGRLDQPGCGQRCLKFETSNFVSSAIRGDPGTRKVWMWLSFDVEFHTLHHLGFQVLLDLTSSKKEDYEIDKVMYAGQTFDSLDELAAAYNNGSATKITIPYPTVDDALFSTLHRRGNLFPDEPLLPPEQYMPSGVRYSVKGRHISYLGWDFDVKMSTIFGPQIFDIRYQNNRIVYELSLQEVAVMYSDGGPAMRVLDVADSLALIGLSSRSLVPGYDCPRYSTFFTSAQMFELSEDTVTSTFCVFEHNTGVPLRRHLKDSGKRKFYEGMVDTVLTVRSIATIANYDYIVDFIFHQNGAVEVKVSPTGYIMSSLWHEGNSEYGFRLKDHVTGNIHIHLFHFRVDMDINGRENRFETLDLEPVEVDNTGWSTIPNARYTQTRFVRREMQREQEAAIKYNFDTPKYLTFYNNANKTELGVPKAYRLFVKGMVKQLYPEDQGQEGSFSWARYQVAVTKYKEDEMRSSSSYASLDGSDPVVNFQTFIDDNDIISDQDQVTWVTMGVHHIPHTEDLPVTTTVGLAQQLFLLPYNFFTEDPAMGSSDATRIEPKSNSDLGQGVKIERYGMSTSAAQCVPRETKFFGMSYEEILNQYPFILFNP